MLIESLQICLRRCSILSFSCDSEIFPQRAHALKRGKDEKGGIGRDPLREDATTTQNLFHCSLP